jgi:hypothetical protein
LDYLDNAVSPMPWPVRAAPREPRSRRPVFAAERRPTASKRAAVLTRAAVLYYKIIRFRKVPLDNSRAGRPDLPFGPQVAVLIIRNHHADETAARRAGVRSP